MEQVGHGYAWWESIKALRAVCDCGDFYPCMRMKAYVAAERKAEDKHWQTSYADELLRELGPLYGRGSAEPLHREVEDILRRRSL